jgi:hypothetical protein
MITYTVDRTKIKLNEFKPLGNTDNIQISRASHGLIPITHHPSHISSMMTSQPTTTTDTVWHYNAMLRIVTHEAHACPMCEMWGQHYLMSVFHSDQTLLTAEAEWDTTI